MEIETNRLRIRRLHAEDVSWLHRITGDSDVMRHWLPGPDRTPEETLRRIADINDHWRLHGFGDWAVVEKATGRLIGFSGLHYISGMAEVNIGYALEKSRWRCGFGMETCEAVLNYGFRTLAFPEIVAVIAPENDASIHLAKKAGLQFWKPVMWGLGTSASFSEF